MELKCHSIQMCIVAIHESNKILLMKTKSLETLASRGIQGGQTKPQNLIFPRLWFRGSCRFDYVTEEDQNYGDKCSDIVHAPVRGKSFVKT